MCVLGTIVCVLGTIVYVSCALCVVCVSRDDCVCAVCVCMDDYDAYVFRDNILIFPFAFYQLTIWFQQWALS